MTKFEEIAREAIKKAEAVPCSLEAFSKGLEEMIDELQERKACVEDELRYGKKNDDGE